MERGARASQLPGTVRYFHKSDGEMVGRRFAEQVNAIAAGYGPVIPPTSIGMISDPLVSDEGLSKAVADDVRGIRSTDPSFDGGEDFANTARSRCRYSPSSDPTAKRDARIGTVRTSWVSTSRCRPVAEFYANAALTVLNELA